MKKASFNKRKFKKKGVKEMKKMVIGISVVVALLVAVSLAMAWGPGYGRGFGYAPNLNLTADQTGKLTSLQQDFLNQTLPIHNELASKALELRTLMSQPGADAAKISAKQQGIFALQQKLQEKSLAYQSDARNILTPQQLSALPPGCGLGFAAGTGYGAGYGGGYGRGRGMGRGAGFGRTW